MTRTLEGQVVRIATAVSRAHDVYNGYRDIPAGAVVTVVRDCGPFLRVRCSDGKEFGAVHASSVKVVMLSTGLSSAGDKAMSSIPTLPGQPFNVGDVVRLKATGEIVADARGKGFSSGMGRATLRVAAVGNWGGDDWRFDGALVTYTSGEVFNGIGPPMWYGFRTKDFERTVPKSNAIMEGEPVVVSVVKKIASAVPWRWLHRLY